MHLWGRNWKREELLSHVGAISQIGGITPFEYSQGKGKGTSCLRVRTGPDLEFIVLPDRGMDVLEAHHKGRSLCWHSPTRVVNPAYYDPRGVQWLKSFGGGLLTTCGLATAGSPSEDAGDQLGLHGAISNVPAENLSWREAWQGDDLILSINGAVREVGVFMPNLVLSRTITTSLGSKQIQIADEVENEGFRESPLMIVYHCNFGFPLLTGRSRIYARSAKVEPRNAEAAKGLDSWDHYEPPQGGIEERVFYHQMQADANGRVTVVLVSDDETKDFGVALRYAKATLPEFVQWKMPGVNHYILGLEPANCRVDGRKAERERGTLQTLKPGEKKQFAIEIEVLDGVANVAKALEAVR